MLKAAIVMGSKSDFETLKPAISILKSFGVETSVRVISAHRTPDAAHEFSKTAAQNGFGVIIAAAGKAAHLAGVIAATTPLPVIALPVKTSMMGGLDSLLSMVQMPAGIPVATVGVDAGLNAGLLAVQILSLSEPALLTKITEYKQKMAENIAADDEELQTKLDF